LEPISNWYAGKQHQAGCIGANQLTQATGTLYSAQGRHTAHAQGRVVVGWHGPRAQLAGAGGRSSWPEQEAGAPVCP
jgi:hypothetical protein